MPSSVSFFSFLAYSPAVDWMARIVRAVKDDREVALGSSRERIQSYLARRVFEERRSFPAPLFGPKVALVPMPRSRPRPPGVRAEDFQWAAYELCTELSLQGLGTSPVEALERTVAVTKSATAKVLGKSRPGFVDHRTSLAVRQQNLLLLRSAPLVLIVDDVVTTGASLLAAHATLRHHVAARVALFAAIRRVEPEELPAGGSMLASQSGTIRLLADGSTPCRERRSLRR